MKNKTSIMDNKFLQAVGLLVGYVIGVGMFGVPFLVSRSGLVSFFVILAILGFIQYLIHLIYANIILETPGYHRMAGYASIYLGKKWKHFTFFAKTLGNYSALLAYIVITGIFLNQLLGPYLGGNEFVYASILFLLEAIVLFFGIGMIAKAELFMSGLLLFTVIFLVARGAPEIRAENFITLDWKYFFLPYGAILFALDGAGIIPTISKLLGKNKRQIEKTIIAGAIIPVVVVVAFTLVILGISGKGTTPDALTGISNILGDGVVIFSLIFGVLTMVTSFLGVSQCIKETLVWDYKVNNHAAWFLAAFFPYMLYLIGVTDLSKIISFAGAIFGGISAIIMILIFLNLRKRSKNKPAILKHLPGKALAGALIAIFILGIIYEIFMF